MTPFIWWTWLLPRKDTVSRTYKNTAPHYFRHPKGHKQAIINGARPKAVPPDDWEDQVAENTGQPRKLVKKMVGQGKEDAAIIRSIRRKFAMSEAAVAKLILGIRKAV